MSLCVTPTCISNTSRDDDSTASLGSLFQSLTALSIVFLKSNLNLPWHNLKPPFSLVLSLVTSEKRQGDEVPPFLQAKYLQFPQLIKLLPQPLLQLHCPSLERLNIFSVQRFIPKVSSFRTSVRRKNCTSSTCSVWITPGLPKTAKCPTQTIGFHPMRKETILFSPNNSSLVRQVKRLKHLLDNNDDDDIMKLTIFQF